VTVDRSKRTEALPILIAFKVIALAEDLTAVERQVAATLLDSFNRNTGQCDPSLERVAGLLNVHRRTVIRATAKLEARGLFRKTRHGGYSHRNHYEPIWSRFRDLEAQWRRRFEAAARNRRTGLSSSTGHASHDASGTGATQTCCSNRANLTLPDRHSDAGSGPGVAPRGRNGLATKVQQLTSYETTRSTMRSIRSADAACSVAERHWSEDLLREFSGRAVVYAAVVDFIDEPLRTAATEAELHKRGNGMALIVERYRDSDAGSRSRTLWSGKQ
jgi:hypothetical protein